MAGGPNAHTYVPGQPPKSMRRLCLSDHAGLVTSSVADYAWFTEDYALGLNFCLTFVRAVAPDEVLERLGGTDPVELIGVRRIGEAQALCRCGPIPSVRTGISTPTG
jgi:hypothetical protein